MKSRHAMVRPFRILAIGPLLGMGIGGTAQTVVWQETFDGTNNWETGANLNQDLGGSCGKSNKFYISCKENGNAAGSCGTGCGSNKTLHVGSSTLGDLGAAYDAGGFSSCGGGCFLCNTTTNKRSWSKVINTTGYGTLSLEFDYIETGQGSTDNALVEYSTDNGSSWSVLQDTPKTNNSGCGGQGRWTHANVPLPASCWNITTLRIGFKWVNNNDGAGSDPSFAVNDVQITTPGTLPVELTSFTAHADGQQAVLEWTTASEHDNAYFSVEHSRDAFAFREVGRVSGTGNSQSLVPYEFKHGAPAWGMNFYRLRQVDLDGRYEYSSVVPLLVNADASPLVVAQMNGDLLITGPIPDPGSCRFMLCDLQGRVLLQGIPTEERLRLDIGSLAPGCLVLRLITPWGSEARAFVR